jgi:hypothetical protein
MARKLSSDEAKFNKGWTCDLCRMAVDRFAQPTLAGPHEDEATKITRHYSCEIVRKKFEK